MDDDASLIAALPLADKVRLLTGADAWRTHGTQALGLRPMVMSDGPAGARGVSLDERLPSTSLPCPSALGATWDVALVGELAAALGSAEVRLRYPSARLRPVGRAGRRLGLATGSVHHPGRPLIPRPAPVAARLVWLAPSSRLL
jgi:hypothetical protein